MSADPPPVTRSQNEPRGEELKLFVDGPCAQACEFCSVEGRDAPAAVAPARAARLNAEIDAGRARGCATLRMTGIDPLAFPGVVEMLARARDLGYERVAIHSPCTRLHDAAFCSALVASSPPALELHVPLYGVSAAVHDHIAGRVGAHALVLGALDQIVASAGPRVVTITTVVMATNLHEVGAIAALARARGFRFFCQLPFPDRDVPSDRFFRISMPQRVVASGLLDGPTPLSPSGLLRVSGLAPCVALAAIAARGAAAAHEARSFLGTPEARRPVPTGVRTPTRACPHASACALVPPCAGELLAAYVTRHGHAEFQPLARV